MTRIYIVDDGDTFEGTAEHWADCFFDNATHANIVDFCNKQGWKLEWRDNG